MEILTKENLVGTKPLPLKLPRLSAIRVFPSDPGSESKISRLRGWRWKNDLIRSSVNTTNDTAHQPIADTSNTRSVQALPCQGRCSGDLDKLQSASASFNLFQSISVNFSLTQSKTWEFTDRWKVGENNT